MKISRNYPFGHGTKMTKAVVKDPRIKILAKFNTHIENSKKIL